MNILVIGNLGYVGPVLTEYLIKKKYKVSGLDNKYFFSNELKKILIKNKMKQNFVDVRDLKKINFKEFYAIVYLAAISNDPMGNKFEKQTYDINYLSAVKIAKMAKRGGVKKFIFASSCSVYGNGGKLFKSEKSKINPLTAYAKSKIKSEKKLKLISSNKFQIICLRFATACGFSPNLRLDLVLNDFVASALINKHINILSDGMPWRPIIHLKDMSRAIEWAISSNKIKSKFSFFNTGNTIMNIKIKDLANTVAKYFKNCKITINQKAKSDPRSYRVDFSKYENLSQFKKPLMNLNNTVKELKKNLQDMKIPKNFRESKYIRLNTLNKLILFKKLNSNLEWKK